MKCLSGNLCLKGIEMPQFKLNPYLKGNRSIVSPQVLAIKNSQALIGLVQNWGRNLTDKFYGEYLGYSAKQIYIGAPRSVELGVTFKF